jgi:HAD superfamily hydrolase (TIGR01509 family)
MSLPRHVRAVVFDMDGLLVDTETLCLDAMMQEARHMGLELPREVFNRMIGTNWALSQKVLVEHFGEAFPIDAFHEGWVARFHAVAEVEVALKAGVVELLDLLDAARLPRAVATSSPHGEVERNLGQHELLHRFHAVVARGDYPRSKPHPDPFLKAAEVLGVPAAQCLALEDSHNGVRAAHAAGMMTIMVPDLLEPTEEMHALCVRIVDSLHEVRDLIAAAASPEETA